MLPGLEIAAAGLLHLAATRGNGYAVRCTVPQPPTININPVTDPINYDFSKTEQQLSAMRSDTVSPYAPGADTTTAGLRSDQPRVETKVEIGLMQNPGNIDCAWYHTVNITISLHPQIYIAQEDARNETCKNAILEHEKKHVVVDRQVMNKYARSIGLAVQKAIDDAGAIGPFNHENLQETQTMMINHITTAAKSLDLAMSKEMRARQSEVDSLDEYTRVSNICQKSRSGKR